MLAGLGILLFALWFLLRRRKRKQLASHKGVENEVDLAEDFDGSTTTGMHRLGSTSTAHVVEPFPTFTSASNPFQHDQASNSPDSSFGEMDLGTATSGTYIGSGGAAYAGLRTSNDSDRRDSGPGVAGPLPAKTHRSPDPPSSSGSRSRTAHSLKAELLGHPTEPVPPLPIQQAPAGSMRIVNHDDPYNIATLPPGARYDDTPVRENRPRRNQGGRRSIDTGPTYRRHEDAGRLPMTRGEEIVDLPPLYTDVPRDGPDFSQSRQDGPDFSQSPQDEVETRISPGSTMSGRGYAEGNEQGWGYGHGQGRGYGH